MPPCGTLYVLFHVVVSDYDKNNLGGNLYRRRSLFARGPVSLCEFVRVSQIILLLDLVSVCKMRGNEVILFCKFFVLYLSSLILTFFTFVPYVMSCLL